MRASVIDRPRGLGAVDAGDVRPMLDAVHRVVEDDRVAVVDGGTEHRHRIRDGATGHRFTGDLFGLSYRGLDRHGRPSVFPATAPSRFDADAFRASIARMTALEPEALFLMHDGRVVDAPHRARRGCESGPGGRIRRRRRVPRDGRPAPRRRPGVVDCERHGAST